ncbi:Methyltransferase domain-containing protein [Nitrosospira multiformis ATCC 25196]|uniref:Methyltransferase domain-containing protein n=2 Tax=Nitrosospira multiformis (strain ATCC 25196 / NCIMB 11849 / C 71) TaxID=323848 RepID=A0A1H5Y1C7_NITMU
MNYEEGCRMPIDEWLVLNRIGIFENPSLRRYVSPFPPPELMGITSGLQSETGFAAHGADIYAALALASTIPITEYRHILDFGCGCGRLARMLKGHPHKISGCDIDLRHVKWIGQSLDFMNVKLSSVRPPIPFADDEMDAVISVSIFTHLTENSQDDFLAELFRVTRPGGTLFLTVHGAQALKRACHEQPIRHMLDMDEGRFRKAQQAFNQNKHGFVLQFGHLTTKPEKAFYTPRAIFRRIRDSFSRKTINMPFEYGIAFHPESYIREHWSKWFDILDYRHGAIHQFQDIVVLSPKK